MSNIRYRIKDWLRPVVKNARIHRSLAGLLHTDLDQIELLVSKLVSVTIPVEFIADAMTIVIPATAGNVVASISVLPNHRFVVLYGRITLICDATVADRKVYFQVTDDAGNVINRSLGSTAITASQTKSVDIHNNVTHVGGTQIDLTHLSTGHKLGLPIFDGDNFTVNVNGGVGGDSYSGFIKILVW